jgi:hypothetical protein
MDDFEDEWHLLAGAAPTDHARACLDLCVIELMFPLSGFRVNRRRFAAQPLTGLQASTLKRPDAAERISRNERLY